MLTKLSDERKPSCFYIKPTVYKENYENTVCCLNLASRDLLKGANFILGRQIGIGDSFRGCKMTLIFEFNVIIFTFLGWPRNKLFCEKLFREHRHEYHCLRTRSDS